VNYKSTLASAEPMAWGRRQMIGAGLYMKAAWYRRGMRAAFQMEVETVYLVQEQAAPFLCSLVGLDPAAKALGEQRMLSASREWAACAHAGSWRGYPARAVYPETPALGVPEGRGRGVRRRAGRQHARRARGATGGAAVNGHAILHRRSSRRSRPSSRRLTPTLRHAIRLSRIGGVDYLALQMAGQPEIVLDPSDFEESVERFVATSR
jgi:hypothetical protein